MNREQKKKLKEAHSMLQDAEQIISELSSEISQEFEELENQESKKAISLEALSEALEEFSTEIGEIVSNLSTEYNLH